MQHPDEGTIHAWLDGALPDDERADLARHVASCAECAVRVAEARGMIAGASRIVGALDSTPGGMIPKFTNAAGPVAATPQASLPPQSLSLWRLLHVTPARAALAASLLVAASLLLTKRHDTADKLVPRAPVASASPSAAAPLSRAPSSSTLTQPNGRPGLSVARMTAVAGNRAALGIDPFVGCYALGAESAQELSALPSRFALEPSAESARGNRNVVRVVTSDGRIDSVLAGSSWHLATPTESNVSLMLPNGPQQINMGLTPGGLIVASVVTDTTSHRIALARIDCRP